MIVLEVCIPLADRDHERVFLARGDAMLLLLAALIGPPLTTSSAASSTTAGAATVTDLLHAAMPSWSSTAAPALSRLSGPLAAGRSQTTAAGRTGTTTALFPARFADVWRASYTTSVTSNPVNEATRRSSLSPASNARTFPGVVTDVPSSSSAISRTGRPDGVQVIFDDEDPPVSFPPVESAEESEWPPRDLHANLGTSNSDSVDQGAEVRSNNPPGSAGAVVSPPSDTDAPSDSDPRPATAPSPEDDGRPGLAAWHLLNSNKCGLSKAALADRIVGGAVAGLGQYPWLARIGYNLVGVSRRVFRCAGTVISHFHVLTAAHCVKNLPPNFEFAGVRLGEWDTGTDPDCQDSVCAPPVHDVDPEAVIIHQDYNSPRFANDIALVKVAKRINFNGWVGPACVPYGDLLTKSYESERTEVAGWGTYDITLQRSSQELRMVHVPVVSTSICHALYRNVADITKKQMCAGGEIGFDACSGDSGGPLVKVEAYSGVPRYYIVGIVSFGSKRCGLTPAPGVYTRVSYYVDWILDNIVQN